MDKALDKKIFIKKICIVASIIFIMILITTITLYINEENRKYKNELSKILISAHTWGKNNLKKLPKNDREIYYLSKDTLIKEKLYKDKNVKKPITRKKLEACILIEYDTISHDYKYDLKEEYCKEHVYTVYKDESGANVPVLSDEMVPVIYKDEKWVRADITKKWYDYNNQEWANIVLVKEHGQNDRSYYLSPNSIDKEVLMDDILAFYVWIPRYKYKLWNTDGNVLEFNTIDIKFESENKTTGLGTKNGEWLTHPAFCTGITDNTRKTCKDGLEVNGLWVSKFETTGDNRMPTVLPNKTPITTYNLSSQYAIMLKMNSKSYGLTSKNYIHIMKNMDWGAIVYLTYSKYGFNQEPFINNNENMTTGCSASSPYSSPIKDCQYKYNTDVGVKASTTGNITGIYDMNGGVQENVMGVLVNGKGTIIVGESNFDSTISKKLYNGYKDKGLLGDATIEFTYNNRSIKGTLTVFPSATQSWFVRGGSYVSSTMAGITSYTAGNGNYANAFRTVLVGD